MEELKVLDFSNVFIADYVTDKRQCVSHNSEHTLIYLCSGELIIEQDGHKKMLHEGECAFIRRDYGLKLTKLVKNGKPYHSVMLKFSLGFLRGFYRTMDRQLLPRYEKRSHDSLYRLPADRPDIQELFKSVLALFDAKEKPSEKQLRLKMVEGLSVVLNTDKSLYASLFDFILPWKINIPDFMEQHYKHNLSVREMAHYTSRSLSTFKRDFKKCSDMTPERWVVVRKLKAANKLLRTSQRMVSEICRSVGFKNLSHFSKAYKEVYGVAPIETQRAMMKKKGMDASSEKEI